jgi:large subunit ribosomal protein L30
MGKIRVTQVKSAIDRTARQKRTLEALGIRKLHQTIEVEATPQVLGMVAKVAHLVKVEPKLAKAKAESSK